MSKKSGKLSKKTTVKIIIIALAVLVAGVAAYYFYMQSQTQQQVEQKKVVADERQKLDDAAFRGDRDLAAEYTAMIQENQPEAAYSLYEAAAKNSTDSTAKIALYEQGVVIATTMKQSDHAIKFAVALSDLANNDRASANVAYLYGLEKDYTNQKKYLQQALDQIETLPKDSPDYVSMKAYYQDMLAKVGTN
jgi:flagellar basal body-associated protein FliL